MLRPRARFGCAGSLLFALGVVAAMYGLLAPWSFHIGGRWTPTTMWHGVGRLRDSTGAQYGLYVQFFPWLRRTGRTLTRQPWPRTPLRGKASVCTAGGAKYPFDVTGQLAGAWLHTDGGQMTLALSEPHGSTKSFLRRAFSLYGTWEGERLPLDDHKSMFMHFRPDGTLTPSGGYTSPVPEKHATVTLEWGNEAEFEALCSGLIGRNSR